MKKTELQKNPHKTSALGPVKCRLVEAFWGFMPAFQRWADSRISHERLTPQRARILDILNERGPQIMSSLKDELGVTATNITTLVDALEEEGWVGRKRHPEDRRATLIEITAKGSRELSQGCPEFREHVGELFSVLTESDRKELLRIMEILRERLNMENN